jgi:hypothetical protein
MKETAENTGSLDMSPEEVQLQLSRNNRLAGLEKARRVRSEKIAAAKLLPKVVTSVPAIGEVDESKKHWMAVFTTLLATFQAKGLKDITYVMNTTDDVIELLEANGKL